MCTIYSTICFSSDLFSVLYHPTMRRSHLNCLGNVQVCQPHTWHSNFESHCLQGHTSSHPTSQAGESTVVGHVLMVHTYSFLCTCHIGMTGHTLAMLQVWDHSRNLFYAHTTGLELVTVEHSRAWCGHGSH